MFKSKINSTIKILMSKIKVKSASNKVAMYARRNSMITIETIFKEIASEEEFIGYHNALDENEIFYFKLFIDHIAMGADVNISPRIYKDRNDIEYVYVNTKYRTGRGGENYKVICFPQFEKFRQAMMTTGIRVTYDEIITKLGLDQKSELQTT